MAKPAWKTWHEVVKLRGDLRTGDLPLHMFAADLYEVMMQNGKRPIYEKPEEFFALTFPTHNLRNLVRGRGTAPGRQERQGGAATGADVRWRQNAHADHDAPLGERPGEPSRPSGGAGVRRDDRPDAPAGAVWRRYASTSWTSRRGCDVRRSDGAVRRLKQPWSLLAYQIAGDEGLKLLHADGKAEERKYAASGEHADRFTVDATQEPGWAR